MRCLKSQTYVLVSAFVVSYFSCKYFNFSLVMQDRATEVSFGGSIASIAATMLGFLLAALAVLASINDTHLVNMMKKTGHYDDLLFSVFLGASIFGGCLCVGFAIMFGVKADSLSALAMSIHISALFSLVDICKKIRLVLINLKN